MSLQEFAKHHHGIIIRQQRETGLLVSPVWAGDYVESVSVSDPAEIATHPLQNGVSGPTDAVLLRPKEISFTIKVSNAISAISLLQHPRPDIFGPERAQRIVEELYEIRDEREPVTILLRGNAPFRNYGLGSISVDWPLDRLECTISCTARALRIVTLGVSAVDQDADLVAVGSQTVEIGVLTAAG